MKATRLTRKNGHNFVLNASFADIKPAEYDGLIIPGGRAPEYLRLNPKVIELVQHFERLKKPIAALCHGAQILAAAHVIEGKRVSAYPACAPEVEAAGGSYAKLNMHEAITDGNLVSGPAWPAHPAFLAQFQKLLEQYLAKSKAAA